jgi:hypothetical protein
MVCLHASTWAASYQAPSSQPVGIVDQVNGSWQLVQPQMRFLARGELIYSGQTVFTQRTTSGSVSILMFASGQRWEKRCSAAAPCEGSYRPSATGDAQKSQTGFWAFFVSYWTPERQLEPVVLGSRSAGDGGPRHALLERSPAGVDLAPALEKVKPASYRLTLAPASSSTTSGKRQETFRIDPNTPSVIVQLLPGLYLLTLGTEAGETVGSSATVLVIDQTDTRIRTAWEEARAVAGAWPASDLTIEALLVRTLYALDAQRKRS